MGPNRPGIIRGNQPVNVPMYVCIYIYKQKLTVYYRKLIHFRFRQTCLAGQSFQVVELNIEFVSLIIFGEKDINQP